MRTFCFLLLPPLTLCLDFQNVFLKKQIGSGIDMTPICTNETATFLMTIFCQVNRAVNACSLAYVGRKNVNKCGSRITLMSQDQTVFLRLVDLKPEDRGTYYCECNGKNSVSKVSLNVTAGVEQGKQGSENPHIILILCSSIAASVVICGVTVSCICKRICCRRRSQSTVRGEETETYVALQQPNKDLYQTITTVDSAGRPGSQDSHVGEYENVRNFAK